MCDATHKWIPFGYIVILPHLVVKAFFSLSFSYFNCCTWASNDRLCASTIPVAGFFPVLGDGCGFSSCYRVQIIKSQQKLKPPLTITDALTVGWSIEWTVTSDCVGDFCDGDDDTGWNSMFSSVLTRSMRLCSFCTIEVVLGFSTSVSPLHIQFSRLYGAHACST